MKHQKSWEEYENHLLNLQLTKRRIRKLKTMFVVCSRFLNLKTAKRKQIEEFINNLNRNFIKKLDGNDFSGSTKADIKKFLKQYYKHTKGKDEFYPQEVVWIKAKIGKDEQPKEKDIVSQEEAIKLSNFFMKIEFKLLTLILYDSGFRIQEMMSVKKKDLTWDDFDDEGNKCFWVKCNVSKTDTRNIPIQLFTEEVRAFYNSTYFRNLKDDDLLFQVSYASYLKMLRNAGLKTLNKPITPHGLRHSSATAYAKLYQGDMIQLANRYGWSYSSRELKTYIRKSKAFHSMGAKKVFQSELLNIKERLSRLEEELLKRAKRDIKRRKKD